MREAFPYGKLEIQIEEGTFKLREYQSFLAAHQQDIGAFKRRQQTAFEEERQRWLDSGQLGFDSEAQERGGGTAGESDLPAGAEAVESPVPGSVWKLAVKPGERVTRGQTLLIVESMKMEVQVESPRDGVVLELSVGEGRAVAPGQRVAVLAPEGSS